MTASQAASRNKVESDWAGRRSAELTVLAAAAIDAGVDDIRVAGGLAVHAGSRSRQHLAPALGDRFPALLALRGALADRDSRPRAVHRVRDGVVDLILDGAVSRPTA